MNLLKLKSELMMNRITYRKTQRAKTNHTWEETAMQLQLNPSVLEMSNCVIPGTIYI